MELRKRLSAQGAERGEGVVRGGAFGLAQSVVNKSSAGVAHLMAHELEEGEFAELVHQHAVGVDALANGELGVFILVARFAGGEHERDGEPLEVPFEGRLRGFVKVVDVKEELAVGSGETAKIAHVGVAADLDVDAGRGQRGEVLGHERDRAAVETERRGGHAGVLQRQELANSSLLGGADAGDGIAVLGRFPLGVVGAGEVVAAVLSRMMRCCRVRSGLRRSGALGTLKL